MLAGLEQPHEDVQSGMIQAPERGSALGDRLQERSAQAQFQAMVGRNSGDEFGTGLSPESRLGKEDVLAVGRAQPLAVGGQRVGVNGGG